MADDMDRITEREARQSLRSHPKWEIDAYATAPSAPDPTDVEVLEAYAAQWTAIEGWVEVGRGKGKVRLAWREEGPPVRPGRPGAR